MAQRGPTRPTARIEEAIGFVGTFGVLFLGVTVFCELTGRPALGWALTLLVCVLGVVVLDRWRVSVLRRTASADGMGGLPSEAVARPVGRPAGARAVGAGAVVAADGRVHRHVGWDELAPAGRRASRRTGGGTVRTVARTPDAPRVAAPAPTSAARDVTRPSDG